MFRSLDLIFRTVLTMQQWVLLLAEHGTGEPSRAGGSPVRGPQLLLGSVCVSQDSEQWVSVLPCQGIIWALVSCDSFVSHESSVALVFFFLATRLPWLVESWISSVSKKVSMVKK